MTELPKITNKLISTATVQLREQPKNNILRYFKPAEPTQSNTSSIKEGKLPI